MATAGSSGTSADSHRPQRSIEAGLGGTQRDAERGGRLGKGEVEVVVEHDHRPLRRVDAGEHARHVVGVIHL
jgi:hypothetical protein